MSDRRTENADTAMWSGVAVTEFAHPSFARMGHPVTAPRPAFVAPYFKASKLGGGIWQVSAR
jgi:hypothetical protein